jgi:Arc/MetJ family transcription regulator
MSYQSTAVDKAVRAILAKAGILGAKELEAWKRPRAEVRKLSHTDYGTSLRRELDFYQIKQLVYRATDVWPNFNRAAVGPLSERFFSRAADALSLHLKAAPYNSLALYGFYVDRSETSLEKPLIFVNSLHHTLAIGTAFCHEVGHHFCTEIAKPKSAGIRFSFDAAYSEHLRDQGELAADVIACLAGYPKAAARAIFEKSQKKDGVKRGHLDDGVFQAARGYLKECYGFDFSAKLSPHQNFQYLAGMIHYAKLRIALLEEYDV